MSNYQVISPLLTVNEALAKLKISRTLLYDLRKEGKISAVLINGSVRFTEEEIERFINTSSESTA